MTELLFLGAIPVAAGVLLTLGLAGLAWWLYWREVFDFPNPYRWLLPTLRALAIALVVLMLLEPTLRIRYFEGTPTRLQIWIDATESMRESDGRQDDTEVKPTRYERAVELLTAGDSPKLEQWAVQGEVMLGTFGGQQTKMLWQSTLAQPNELPQDQSTWRSPEWLQPTSLSLLLSSARTNHPRTNNSPTDDTSASDKATSKTKSLSQKGSDPLEASRFSNSFTRLAGEGQTPLGLDSKDAEPTRNEPILWLTDGQHNAGSSPLESIGQWPKETAPIFILGMGSTTLPEKVTLVQLDTPKQVFRTDRVQGTLQFQDGLKTGTNYTLQIFHGTDLLWSKEVQSAEPGRRSEAFSFSVSEVIAKLEAALPSGETVTRLSLPLTAKVELPHNAELKDFDTAGDEITGVLGVTTRQQRILMLDSRSRWETRYLRNLLERDPQWELDAYLLKPGQTPAWFSNVAEERSFPSTPEDFERYDLFICGELEPGSLTAEQMDLMRFAIQRGAGWLVVDGQRGYWQRTEQSILRDLLPIDWQPAPLATEDAVWQAVPEPDALSINMLSLTDGSREDNQAVWEKLPSLRSLVATKALPGSQVLASARLGSQTWPLFVTRNYGAGRVFYVAADDTWRWRYEVADQVHQKLWNQISRWTMREPFAVENEYLALDSGDAASSIGQSILIRARVRDSQGQPSELPTIEAIASLADQPAAAATLELQPGATGIYQGRLNGLPPGDYKIQLAIPGYSEEMTQLLTRVRVEAPGNPERLQVARNDDLLMEIATATGGRYFPESEAERLWQELNLRYGSRIVESDQLVWQSFWWFVPILLLVSLEWWLRKKVGLI